MDFKIKKIILWPKDQNKTRKEIPFELNKVNVIVGDSQTGKSSLIPIIDYCLGSSKCTIPVGPIRDYTGWFGILVCIGKDEMLLARREPGTQQSTSDMFYDEGKTVVIPDIISEKNRTNDQVVNRFNQLSQLPSLDFVKDEKEKQPYENRPSFKDFLAFCFQPQHIIANPYTMFYKADTVEHRFKLQTIFPLALGLIKNETLEIEKRIKLLRDQLREKQNILEEKKKLRKAWESEIKANYLKAIDLGILKDTPFPEDNWELETYVGFLERVPEIMASVKFPTIDTSKSNRVLQQITKLNDRENNLLDEIEDVTFKIFQIRNFNSSSIGLGGALNNQKLRLEPVYNGWFSKKISKINNCPVCGSDNHDAKKEIALLVETSKEIEKKVSRITSSKSLLDKEVTELEKQLVELEKQLNSVRSQLDAFGRQDEKIEDRRKSIETVYRYVGKIEQNLKNLNETKIDSGLVKSIHKLDEEIEKLLGKINTGTYNSRKDAIIKRISQDINYYKDILKVENASNPTELDIKELSINVLSVSTGRKDHLWEIGSGSNWMGYHVSTILALHNFFITLNTNNHVPTFIVFDQPSQAYFPEAIKNKEEEQQKSDDLVRVKAIFDAFSKFLKKNNFKTQVIVLEHASNEIWGDIENTHFVLNQRWDTSNALIPNEWIKR